MSDPQQFLEEVVAASSRFAAGDGDIFLVAALQELCTMLCVGGEVFVRHLARTKYAEQLLFLLHHAYPSEVRTLAARALAIMLDNVPRTSESVVELGGVSLLLEACTDEMVLLQQETFCEEILKCVSLMSLEVHEALIERNAVGLLMAVFPVLPAHQRKLILACIANLFAALRPEDWTSIEPSAILLKDLLLNHVHVVLGSVEYGTPPSGSSYPSPLTAAAASAVNIAREEAAVSSLFTCFLHMLDRTVVDDATAQRFVTSLHPLASVVATILCRADEFSNALAMRNIAFSFFTGLQLVAPTVFLRLMREELMLELVSECMHKITTQAAVNFSLPLSNASVAEAPGAPSATPSPPSPPPAQSPVIAAGMGGFNSDHLRRQTWLAHVDSFLCGYLEFLLFCVPPARLSLDQLYIMAPFHQWTWSDEFHNRGEYEEMICRRLDAEYVAQRRRGEFGPFELRTTSRSYLVDFARLRHLSRSGQLTRPLSREPVLVSYTHRRMSALCQLCTCQRQLGDVPHTEGDPQQPIRRMGSELTGGAATTAVHRHWHRTAATTTAGRGMSGSNTANDASTHRSTTEEDTDAGDGASTQESGGIFACCMPVGRFFRKRFAKADEPNGHSEVIGMHGAHDITSNPATIRSSRRQHPSSQPISASTTAPQPPTLNLTIHEGGTSPPWMPNCTVLLTDPYEQVLLAAERRRAFSSATPLLQKLVTHVVPCLLTLMKSSVNPLINRHCLVLLLRCLQLITFSPQAAESSPLAPSKPEKCSPSSATIAASTTGQLAELLSPFAPEIAAAVCSCLRSASKDLCTRAVAVLQLHSKEADRVLGPQVTANDWQPGGSAGSANVHVFTMQGEIFCIGCNIITVLCRLFDTERDVRNAFREHRALPVLAAVADTLYVECGIRCSQGSEISSDLSIRSANPCACHTTRQQLLHETSLWISEAICALSGERFESASPTPAPGGGGASSTAPLMASVVSVEYGSALPPFLLDVLSHDQRDGVPDSSNPLLAGTPRTLAAKHRRNDAGSALPPQQQSSSSPFAMSEQRSPNLNGSGNLRGTDDNDRTVSSLESSIADHPMSCASNLGKPGMDDDKVLVEDAEDVLDGSDVDGGGDELHVRRVSSSVRRRVGSGSSGASSMSALMQLVVLEGYMEKSRMTIADVFHVNPNYLFHVAQLLRAAQTPYDVQLASELRCFDQSHTRHLRSFLRQLLGYLSNRVSLVGPGISDVMVLGTNAAAAAVDHASSSSKPNASSNGNGSAAILSTLLLDRVAKPLALRVEPLRDGDAARLSASLLSSVAIVAPGAIEMRLSVLCFTTIQDLKDALHGRLRSAALQVECFEDSTDPTIGSSNDDEDDDAMRDGEEGGSGGLAEGDATASALAEARNPRDVSEAHDGDEVVDDERSAPSQNANDVSPLTSAADGAPSGRGRGGSAERRRAAAAPPTTRRAVDIEDALLESSPLVALENGMRFAVPRHDPSGGVRTTASRATSDNSAEAPVLLSPAAESTRRASAGGAGNSSMFSTGHGHSEKVCLASSQQVVIVVDGSVVVDDRQSLLDVLIAHSATASPLRKLMETQNGQFSRGTAQRALAFFAQQHTIQYGITAEAPRNPPQNTEGFCSCAARAAGYPTTAPSNGASTSVRRGSTVGRVGRWDDTGCCGCHPFHLYEVSRGGVPADSPPHPYLQHHHLIPRQPPHPSEQESVLALAAALVPLVYGDRKPPNFDISASAESFADSIGYRRLNSAITHELQSQSISFAVPAFAPLCHAVARGEATPQEVLPSYAFWNYPLVYPFPLRVKMVELMIHARRLLVPKVALAGVVGPSWLAELPQQAMPHTLHAQTQQQQHQHQQGATSPATRIKATVNRQNLFDDGIAVLFNLANCPLSLDVSFENEPGTGLGPTAEFFSSIARAFAAKRRGMWRDPSWQVTKPRDDGEGNSSIPGNEPAGIEATSGEESVSATELFPSTRMSESALAHFEDLGVFVGKLLQERRTVRLPLHPVFVRSIQRIPLEERDLPECLQLVDPVLEQSLRSLESMQPQDLRSCDLTFLLPGEELIELVQDGAARAVTCENVTLYTTLVRRYILITALQAPVNLFLSGLGRTCVHPRLLGCFTEREVQLLLCGQSGKLWPTAVSLRSNIVAAHGYTHHSRVVEDLIDIVVSWDENQQRRFLRFISGSDALPISGLQQKITVVKRDPDPDATPSRVNRLRAMSQEMPPSENARASASPPPRLEFGDDSPGAALSAIDAGRDGLGEREGPQGEVAGERAAESGIAGNDNPRQQSVLQEVLDESLPTVNTCFLYLKLPEYSTRSVMESRLALAIYEGLEQFMLS